jgi:hypothetical protein
MSLVLFLGCMEVAYSVEDVAGTITPVDYRQSIRSIVIDLAGW